MDNFNLKKFVSEKSLLNENAPGYDTRKTGEPLPTLESVKAAYEAKGDKSMADMDFRPGVGKDSTWAPTRKQQRAAEKEIKEGVWNIGNPDDIQKFISILVELKNDYWNVVGSDTVMDGLDMAIKGANELLSNAINPGSNNMMNEGIIAEAKKSELDKKLAEIDKAGAITTLEAKINAIDEAIEAKNSRINMVQEDENLSELIDKKRVKEMQKEIKLLERSKKLYEKQLDKVNGKKKAKKEIVDEYNVEPHNAPDNSMDSTMDEREYKY